MSPAHPQAAVIYHYTGPDGLHSMLSSGHIWATDAAYMNDPNELRYGYDVLAEVVVRERRLQRVQADLCALIERVAHDKIMNGRVYLASFCEDGDLLSQWRAYGAFGAGFAIGLRRHFLLGRSEKERPPFRKLSPVLYDRRRQERILREWLGKVVNPDRLTEQVEFRLLELFSDVLMTFKHPSYEAEGEWRLVQFGRVLAGYGSPEMVVTPPHFRVRKDGIIPYADLDLTRSQGTLRGKLPVVEIVCGPTVHRERGLKAIRQLAEAQGFDLQDEAGRWPQRRARRPRLVIRSSSAPFNG